MNRISANCLKVSVFVIFAFFTVIIFSRPLHAGDYTMQTNLNEVADQMARWSKQYDTEKLTPEARAELSKLLLETSQMLKEMAGKIDSKMHMEHYNKLQMMKKSWDPFDTADRM